MRGLSLVAASGDHSSSRCAGLSLSRPLLLRSTGSRRTGSVVVAHGRSCSAACGIFPDQGSNPCPLHWPADSQPLRHQGSPPNAFFKGITQKMYFIMFHLKHNESKGEACFLLFKIGSLLKFVPISIVVPMTLVHSATSPQIGTGSVKMGPLANLYKI